MTVQIKGAKGLAKKLRSKDRLKLMQAGIRKHVGDFQTSAQRDAPVDTGELKRSIRVSFQDSGTQATIGAYTNYSAYVEYGTRHMSAQPYFRPNLYIAQVEFMKDMAKVAML